MILDLYHYRFLIQLDKITKTLTKYYLHVALCLYFCNLMAKIGLESEINHIQKGSSYGHIHSEVLQKAQPENQKYEREIMRSVKCCKIIKLCLCL